MPFGLANLEMPIMTATLAALSSTHRVQSTDYRTIEVVPSDATIGADILGFDFADPSDNQLREMRQAWLDHSVVRFRGSRVSDQDQITFTGKLGEFVKHPRQLSGEEGAHPQFEEILVIANADQSGKPAGSMGNKECRWHSDTYIVDRPPAGAILKAVQLPAAGGNTYFSDMYAIYDDLEADLKRDLNGRMIQLDIVYDGAMRVRKGMEEPASKDVRIWPSIRHPIVRTHGESGRNALYLAAETPTAWIVGLPLDESTDILTNLWQRVAQDRYHWVQSWQPDDIVMWDNRCLKHRRDGWPESDIRIMHRTTFRGERPYFRY